MTFRIKGETFFSLYALNHNFLRIVLEEIMKLDDTFNKKEENESYGKKMLFLHLLYPNNEDQSAFDLAMEKKSPKSIEVMLKMLCKLEDLSLSKYLLHHFAQLFTMELTSFHSFLDSCVFQLPKMRQIKEVKWNHKEDEIYVDYHTSYLSEHFYEKSHKKNDIHSLRKYLIKSIL